MPITEVHELHRRRMSRNVGVAVTLVAFIALVFGLTIAKVQRGGTLEAFDHGVRPGLAERAAPEAGQ
jgi:hypothetical protein